MRIASQINFEHKIKLNSSPPVPGPTILTIAECKLLLIMVIFVLSTYSC